VTSLTHLAAPVGPGVLVDDLGRQSDARIAIPSRVRTRVPGLAVPWALLVSDLVAALAGVVAAYAVGAPLRVLLLVPIAWLALLVATRSYETRRHGVGLGQSLRRVVRASVGMIVLGVAFAALADASIGPAGLLLVAGVAGSSSIAPRVVRDVVITRVDAAARSRTRVIVAGKHPQDVAKVLAELRREPHHGLDVAGVCLAHRPRRTTFDVPVAVGLDHLADTAAAADARAVIVLPCDHIKTTVLRRIGWQLEQAGVNLFVGTPLLDVEASRTTVVEAAGLRMLRVRPAGRRGPAHLVKSVLERPLAFLMLALLLPVLATVSLLIRADSPGPAIFRQQRVGRDGKLFTMYKFRTMSDGAHQAVDELSEQNESDAVLFKMRQDPRITRIGAVLRKYSVDEVPQLINVLLGHMSLVGPRPALQSEVLQYCQDARRRLAVRPGLTGLWQVSGRSDLSWEDTVRLDVKYVDNWSLALDFSILVRTVQAVLGHRGAY
jgi:exopolysaccharide biosynthesis polyprenyl glycosylphosphotransferase